MADLPEELYAVWRLACLEDLPVGDIADELQLAVTTVRKSVARAKNYLDKRLAKLS
jgi:DNA-directed RNA polymerase specialized sigma24 family protein